MANLVKIAEDLEYVPKEQLIEMVKNPNNAQLQGTSIGFMPAIMPLLEMQRRTQMEKIYAANTLSMNQPERTLSEEIVSDFAQPKGLAGMNANGSANVDAFSPDAAMPASPMQMAAIGGRTGFQNLGQTSRARANLLASFGIDPSNMTPEQIEKAIRDTTMQETSNIAQQYETDFEDDLLTKIKLSAQDVGKHAGVLKDDFSLDPVGAGIAAASAFPIARGIGTIGTGISKLASKIAPDFFEGARGLGRQALRLFTKPKTTGYRQSQIPYQVPKDSAIRKRTVQNVFSPSQTARTIGYGGLGAMALRKGRDVFGGDESGNIDATKKGVSQQAKAIEGDVQKGKKGLSHYTDKFLDTTTDGLHIARLGAIIMGSNSLSEFGKYMQDFTKDVVAERADAKTEARLEALSGIQGAYYQAQIDAMPAEQLADTLKQYAAFAKGITDQTIEVSEEEKVQFAKVYKLLLDKQAAMEGINIQTQDDTDKKTMSAFLGKG